jgi:flagellar L-ring protein precursor FlgH
MRYSFSGGIFLATLVFGTVVLQEAQTRADSIWERRDHRAAYLFEDNRARRVGDLLTVQVNEISNVNEQDKRDMDKATSFTNVLGYKGSSSAGSGVSRAGQLDFNINGSTDRTFKGQAQYQSNRVFTDNITVTVIDVQPNGNLVVEGYRRRMVSGELRTLKITGIVRPVDIGGGNIVQSQYVANFRISYLGKGPETSFANQGYFGKALNLLWPF